jgi:hypothetical protein
MRKQKDGKRAKEKRPYIGPRVTVLSPNSERAKKLVNEAGNESRNEDQKSGPEVKSEVAKAKKRSA